MKYWDIITPAQQRILKDRKKAELNQRLQAATNLLACKLIRIEEQNAAQKKIDTLIDNINHGLSFALENHSDVSSISVAISPYNSTVTFYVDDSRPFTISGV